MAEFIHLHNHTEFSLLDGCARIKKLVSTCKERGATAVAITDHGNMFGVLQFYKACLENKIKPIIGCEFYACNDMSVKSGKPDIGHLILIAKNNTGYKNLLKLNALAFKEGFYYKPRIDYKTIKEHSEGLICMSACLAGHIPQLILKRDYEGAEKKIIELKNMFADGDFYLEIQNHGIPEQQEIMPKMREFSNKFGIKLVATNDCHYINREDAEMQDVLMCVQMGKTIDDPDRMKFQCDEFYLKTYEEMAKMFVGYEDALETPNEIADKCDITIVAKSHGDIRDVDDKYVLPASQNYIPKYEAPNGMTTFEFLKKLCYDGLKKKYKVITPEIQDRADSELQIIKDQGFVEYFLVVWDYINYAREHDIPVGPGRGSGAGSIVAYTSGITNVDPLKYDLIFERFIHKERVSMPDFDVDFCFDRRGEVIEYVKRKYSEDNVALIVTFGTMAAKNAIKDVARVLKMPYAEVDRLTKPIPNKLPEGIKKPPVLKYYFGKTGKEEDEKYIIPELKKLYDEDAFVRKVVDMAIKLEGSPRNCSTHAAGVLIAPEPVDNYVPVCKVGEDTATQYNMIELEDLGLLKMDFLGLKTLTDIDKCIKMVKKETGKVIDFYNMEYDDPNVYKLISSGNTDAIFQLESAGMKKFMKDLKPDCLEDIIAGVSLYRPGPMDSIPRYIKNKQNPDHIEYDHPMLEPILKVTYGCIVYQEQVMKIVQVMGGYSMGQADMVRRIMGKKKKDKMAIEKEKFIYGWEDPKGEKNICGALKKGVSKEVAEKVFAEMESFASYAFNKSHAAAYAYLTYQTAYLKCYYPKEFLASVINNRITNIDEIKKYINYAKSQGYEVLQPDINKSEAYFSVQDGKIRFGLAGLKGVGIGVVEKIIEERENNGSYLSFTDFVNRSDNSVLNKRVIEGLILCGAFDSTGAKRSQLMAVYEQAIEMVMKDRKTKATGQFSFFDLDNVKADVSSMIDLPDIKEFSSQAKLKFEKEVVGVYITGHPLDNYIDKLNSLTFNSLMVSKEDSDEEEVDTDEENNIPSIDPNQTYTCGGIVTEIRKMLTKKDKKEMASVKIEDLYGTVSCMFFVNQFERYKGILQEEKMYTFIGKVSNKSNETTFLVEKVIPWEEKQDVVVEKKETLYLRYDTNNPLFHKKVIDILNQYKGECDVIVKCTSNNKAYKLDKKVIINNYLKNELYGLLSEEDVIIK